MVLARGAAAALRARLANASLFCGEPWLGVSLWSADDREDGCGERGTETRKHGNTETLGKPQDGAGWDARAPCSPLVTGRAQQPRAPRVAHPVCVRCSLRPRSAARAGPWVLRVLL